MAHEVMFEVPKRLQEKFAAGSIERVGALLVDSNTHQIIAHMQETRGLSNLLMRFADGMPGSLNAMELVADGVQIYQNHRIAQAINALQFQSMLLGLGGIGISIVGFAVLSRKLSRLEQAMNEFAGKIDQVLLEVQEHRREFGRDRMQRRLSSLGTQCKRIDEAVDRNDPMASWKKADEVLHDLQEEFLLLATGLNENSVKHIDDLDMFIEAMVLAGMNRIKALVALEDFDVAIKASRELSRTLNGLTGRMDTLQFVNYQLSMNDKVCDLHDDVWKIENLVPKARARTEKLREREQAVATLGITLDAMALQGDSGKDVLMKLRGETSRGVAFLIPERPGLWEVARRRLFGS